MSLIASASPWVNDDPTVAQRKRIATMKKPNVSPPLPIASSSTQDIRTFSTNREENTHVTDEEEGGGVIRSKESKETSHLAEIVNKIADTPSRLSLDNAGNGLADFAPRDMGITLPPQPIRNPGPSSAPFAPNPNHTASLNNYRQSYETPPTRGGVPNGVAVNRDGGTDVKVADRLSYIIHMLEEMKNEKTNNVTEEFVLYSLLGIFVIYLVDAFARTGKYTR